MQITYGNVLLGYAMMSIKCNDAFNDIKLTYGENCSK